jgi:hypothetical protein
MLQFAFKFAIVLAAIGAQAQTVVTGAMGADAWGTSEGQARYLPNYGIKSAEWRPLNPWVNATVRHETQVDSLHMATTAQGIYDPIKGGRLHRLDVDVHSPQDGFGARLGVVPYRMTWCRSYDQGTPWITEPDVFCRFSGLNEMNQSAAGVQGYGTVDVAGWALDALVGEYRPQIYGGDNKLGPFIAVGPTTSHTKRGAAVNALHLASGSQIRAGFLRTEQDQDSTANDWRRQLRYDSYYLAAEANPTPKLAVRVSLSAYVGDQINNAAGGAFAFDGRSTTVEAMYTPTSGHTLAMGLSQYTNTTIYQNYVGVQRLTVPSFMASYRCDLSGGWYGIGQVMHTTDVFIPISGPQQNRQGNAVGVRLSRAF